MDFTKFKPALSRYAALVVTGGSSGIGAEMIQRFHQAAPDTRIFNLSRSQPDAGPAQNQLEHIPCDLTDSDSLTTAEKTLLARLAALSDGPLLVINNSGIGHFGLFQEIEREKHLKVIDLNIRGTVDITLRLLPELLKRGGDIMTIASTSAYQPTPKLSTYGATKSFLMHWSLALSEDLRGTGVRTLVVCPGPTRTAFLDAAGIDQQAKAPMGFQTTGQVAWASYHALAKGRPLVVPGIANRLLATVSALGPKRLSARVAAHIMDTGHGS
ncbi:MAG: SDR family NAD(P)-dependent oxidoreductase [Opitutales bacterium]